MLDITKIADEIGQILRVMPVVLILVISVSLIEALLVLPSHLGHALAAGQRRSRPHARPAASRSRRSTWCSPSKACCYARSPIRPPARASARRVTLPASLERFLSSGSLLCTGSQPPQPPALKPSVNKKSTNARTFGDRWRLLGQTAATGGPDA